MARRHQEALEAGQVIGEGKRNVTQEHIRLQSL